MTNVVGYSHAKFTGKDSYKSTAGFLFWRLLGAQSAKVLSVNLKNTWKAINAEQRTVVIVLAQVNGNATDQG